MAKARLDSAAFIQSAGEGRKVRRVPEEILIGLTRPEGCHDLSMYQVDAWSGYQPDELCVVLNEFDAPGRTWAEERWAGWIGLGTSAGYDERQG